MPSFPLRVAPAARTVLLGAALTAALPASSLAAGSPTPTTATPAPAAKARKATVKPGVTFGELDLSGQTKNQAKSLLRRTLNGQRPSSVSIVARVGGRPHRLRMSTIGYRFDLEQIAKNAVSAPPNTALKSVETWSSDPLAKWFSSISSIGRQARNATVSIGITKQRYTGSSAGWRVDRGALEGLVTPLLKDPTKPRDVRVKVVRTSAAVTVAGLKRQYGTIVTVDRQTFRLRLFKRLKLEKTYKIAVGSAGHGTPAGMYSVTSKQVNPAWHVPNSGWAGDLAGQVIPGGASNNPLKARWLGLRDGIGIHGTAETWSLGSRASHGCIRMHPNDVIDLYPRVPMGTTVKVR
jgi:hypothetical protein